MSMIYQTFCWASSYINFYLYNKTTRLIFYFCFAIEKTDTQRIKWFSLGYSGVAKTWSHVHVIPQSILTLLSNLALSIYSFEYFFLRKKLWENLLTVSQPSKLHHDLQHLLSFRAHKPLSVWEPGNVALFNKQVSSLTSDFRYFILRFVLLFSILVTLNEVTRAYYEVEDFCFLSNHVMFPINDFSPTIIR